MDISTHSSWWKIVFIRSFKKTRKINIAIWIYIDVAYIMCVHYSSQTAYLAYCLGTLRRAGTRTVFNSQFHSIKKTHKCAWAHELYQTFSLRRMNEPFLFYFRLNLTLKIQSKQGSTMLKSCTFEVGELKRKYWQFLNSANSIALVVSSKNVLLKKKYDVLEIRFLSINSL